MAYKLGIADGYLDFLFTLKAFLTSYSKLDNIVNTVGAGANGWMSREWAADDSGVVQDAWTILFTSPTAYTVTGVSNGLQTATGTVGVDYTTDGGECGWRIIAGGVAWAIGDTITFDTETGMAATQKWSTNRYNMVYDTDIDYSGVDNYTVKGNIGNPNYNMWAPFEETWTITCVISGSSGVPAEFQVVGSESGAQANATADVPYDNDLVSFTITTGAVEWDGSSGAADTITFLVPTAREIFFEAPGNAGNENIFTMIRTYELRGEGQDVFQWLLNGATGFDATKNFSNQPDTPATIEADGDDQSVYIPRCIHQERDMPYWIVANGRRVTVFYEVGEVIETMYLGLILPYAFPTDEPYSLFVGGTTSSYLHAYTDETVWHRAWFDPPCAAFTGPGGMNCAYVWSQNLAIAIGNIYNESLTHQNDMISANFGGMWPYLHKSGSGAATSGDTQWLSLADVGPDGSLCYYPIIPWCRITTKMPFGEVEGVYALKGGTLNPKDTIDIGGTIYVLFPNTHRTHKDSWCALRLE